MTTALLGIRSAWLGHWRLDAKQFLEVKQPLVSERLRVLNTEISLFQAQDFSFEQIAKFVLLPQNSQRDVKTVDLLVTPESDPAVVKEDQLSRKAACHFLICICEIMDDS